MACNCTKTKAIPACVTNLTIGTLTANTNYHVYLQTANGRTDRFDATSNNDGLLTITNPKVRAGVPYNLWVTDATSSSAENRLNIIIDNEPYTCLELLFTPVHNTANAFITYTNQTVTVVI